MKKTLSAVPVDANADRIDIQQLITIATVVEDPSGYGENPMVVEAFKQAGKFLNEKGADGEEAALQFTYRGILFHASCGPEEDS